MIIGIIIREKVMQLRILSLIIPVLFLFACKQRTGKLEVTVENMYLLDSVPSGSGLVVHDDTIFIIGDDATHLYMLSMDMKLIRKVPLLNTDSSLYRIAKPFKHDLESLTATQLNGRTCLLAFGSGSVSPQRDSMLVIPLHNPYAQQWISMSALYSQLRAYELNIEAAVVLNNNLFLFNRSGNRLYQLPLQHITEIAGLKPPNTVSPRSLQFSLPMLGGLKTGFSGAAALDNKRIIFSASAENLPNVYEDGDIQGSLIGTLYTGPTTIVLEEIVVVKDKRGIVLKDKIESIDIAGKYPNGDIRLAAVADNDDGRSKMFELRISYVNN